MKAESAPVGEWAGADGARDGIGRIESSVFSRRSKETRSSNSRTAIRVMHRYGAPPRHAFEAWLDPEVAGRWLFATASRPMAHVEIDARVGGLFRFVDRRARETITYKGQYVEIAPERRLVFTLSMDPQPNLLTRVSVAIAARARGCALELMHENVPWDRVSYLEGRWTGILYGLGVTLDSIPEQFHHEQE